MNTYKYLAMFLVGLMKSAQKSRFRLFSNLVIDFVWTVSLRVSDVIQWRSYTIKVTATDHCSITTVSYCTDALDIKTIKPLLLSWQAFQWLCILCISPHNPAKCWTTIHSATSTSLQKNKLASLHKTAIHQIIWSLYMQYAPVIDRNNAMSDKSIINTRIFWQKMESVNQKILPNVQHVWSNVCI